MQQKEVKNNGGARENAQTPNKRKKKQRADAIRGRPPPSLSIAALALQLARRAFFQPPAAPECAYDESPLQLCSRKLRARGEGTPPPPPRGSTPRFPLASAQAQPTTKKINPSLTNPPPLFFVFPSLIPLPPFPLLHHLSSSSYHLITLPYHPPYPITHLTLSPTLPYHLRRLIDGNGRRFQSHQTFV